MNYDRDNKFWRVVSPLFIYFGIRLIIETIFYVVVLFVQVKDITLSAAINGIDFVNKYGENMMNVSLVMSAISIIVAIPIMYFMIKKDYEYPTNPKKRERVFRFRAYNKISYKKYILPAVVGITASLGIGRLILMLPFDEIIGSYSQVQSANASSPWWLQLIVLGLLSPVLEEMLFRGVIFNRLKMYYDVTIAVYISAIIFGVAHLNLLQGIYGFIMGLFFSYIYEKYGNIFIVIGMHIAANVTSVIMGINPLSKFIDSHIIVRIIAGVVMTGIFAVAIMKIYDDEK